MATDVDRLLTKPASEPGDIGHRDMVQRPEEILVERDRTLVESDLDAIRQQIVLPVEVLFLDPEVVNLPKARALAAELEARNVELNQTLGKLTRLQDQLVVQQESEEVGRLTAGIAHEILNPLNLAQNFAEGSAELAAEMAEALEEGSTGLKGCAELEEVFRGLAESSQRASQTIERVLEFGGASTATREVDIGEVVLQHARIAIEGQQRGTALRIGLASDIPPGQGRVRARGQAIARLAINLVTNACQAIAERAEAGCEDGYEPLVTIRVWTCPERAVLEVGDNGAGIDPGIRDRVAEPFFTTRASQDGVGLGLSECTDIVRMHQGTMGIQSGVGEGTTVRIEIPAGEPSRPGR